LLLSSLGSLLPVPLLSSDTEEQRSLLDVAGRGFKARLDEIDDRVRRNADVLAQIVDDSRSFLGEEKQENSPSLGTERSQPDDAKEEGALAAKSDQTATDKPSEKFPDSNSGADKKIAKKSGRTSHPRIPDHDLDKVRSTIKQYVRDWSVEGLSEREAAYDPILDALESSFKHISSAQRSQLRVLVPGAGLGRLAFEIAWLGFSCQGNEFR
jgi:carnosine N-methyltransferase